MLLIDAPNIFRGAGNDYNVKVMKCTVKTYGVRRMALVNQFARAIYKETGIDALSRTKYRGGKYPESRHLLIYFLKQYTEWSLRRIAMSVGGKDHVMTYNSIKRVNEWKDTDKDFRNMFYRIDEEIKKIEIT
jgi:hypothetical protein